jgi:hypothetical protein
MMSLRSTFALLAALIVTALAPTAVRAQQQQGTNQSSTQSATTTTVNAPVNAAGELAIKQMTARLRTVQIAQDAHYIDHGTYTTSMTSLGRYESSLAMPKPPKAGAPAVPIRRDSVSVQIIFAGGRGWTGIASHWGLRGRSCVVYVGMPEELPKIPITRADRRAPTEEGVPACDSLPAPSGTPTPAPPQPQPVPAPSTPPSRQ